MRILGIDPGTLTMGYGLIDFHHNELSFVSCGIISADKNSPLPQRLSEIYTQLQTIIKKWKPVILAIENPFVSNNPKTALAIGQAQGAAFIAAAQNGLEISSYPPRLIKQTVTNFGGASKEQVQEMVRMFLEMDFLPEPSDVADSLAVAICHTRVVQEQDLISKAQEVM